ncbi:MAG: GNAT family N-acetyltransferase [Opitutales bacterium]
MSQPPAVTHHAAARRFEIKIADALAVAEYELAGHRMILTHTLVPPELRGRGLAEQLVRTALAEAASRQLRVVPQCSYVATFIQRHPEFQHLVDA